MKQNYPRITIDEDAFISESQTGQRILIDNLKNLHSVVVNFTFDTGSIDEDEKSQGFTHLLEHMFYKSNEVFSANEVLDNFERLGGIYNGTTTDHQTHFWVTVPFPLIHDAIYLLQSMLTKPLFLEDELEVEKGVVLDEIRRGNDETFKKIYNEYKKITYKNPRYSHPVIGTEESIKNCTRKDLVRYWKKHFSSKNLTISIIGKIPFTKQFTKSDLTDMLSQIKFNEKTYIKRKISDSHNKPIYKSKIETYGIKDSNKNQITLFISFDMSHLVPKNNKKTLQMGERDGIVINEFIDEFICNHSVSPFASLREEKGYCYGIYAGFDTAYQQNELCFRTSTSPELLEEFLKHFKECMEKISSNAFLNSEEAEELFNSIQNSYSNRTVLAMDSSQSISMFYKDIRIVNHGAYAKMFLSTYLKIVNGIDYKDVKKVISNMNLSKAKMKIGYEGPITKEKFDAIVNKIFN